MINFLYRVSSCPSKISSSNSLFLSLFFPQKALDVFQISREDQEQLFKILAAVLWLGNVSIRRSDNENHAMVVDDEGMIESFEFCIIYAMLLLTWNVNGNDYLSTSDKKKKWILKNKVGLS